MDAENMMQSARMQLKQLQQQLAAQNVTLTFTENVIKTVAQRGYTKESGAQHLKQEIQSFIVVPVSQFLHANPKATTLKIDVLDGILIITNESVTAP